MRSKPCGNRRTRLILWVGTFFFGVLWLNNLIGAVIYHARLISGTFSADSLDCSLFSFLRWSAVDASTVTTFIPAFGFALMLHGLRHPSSRDDWPFFPGYERLNIALGLLGTVWGIILIGYYPADQVAITSLMQCLHTAMFSTLIAVGWVMVLLPLVLLPWLHRARGQSMQQSTVGEVDVGLSLEALSEKIRSELQNSARELTATGQAAEAFRKAMQGSQQELAGYLENFAQARKQESEWLKEAAAVLQKLTEASGHLTEHQKLLDEENRVAKERAELLEQELESARIRASELQRKLNSVGDLLR